ncbi:hypothetical protein BGW38_002214 [Lunasporangiospora selenospora]|uniref:Uncharacterized protein n=1 Tax=Lunasporangiospora selenospora TaxID=979761 RepID=A0A9P6KDK8_9FUNG|nr:hypothetical protein BGW38_002214 [Lunasporangiospora selenospora]
MSVLFGRKTAGTKPRSINYARGLVVSLYLISWTFSLIATMLAQTNNFNALSCNISIYTCIILYACSKIIIYLFLMEKVYVVTAVGATRANFMGPSKGRLRDVARRTLLGSVVALVLSTANVFTLVVFQGHERGLICLASCTIDVTLNAMSVHWVTSRGGSSIGNAGTGADGSIRGGANGGERSIAGAEHRQYTGYQMTSENQVSPLDSHVSVTVESYVEQYHHQFSNENDPNTLAKT